MIDIELDKLRYADIYGEEPWNDDSLCCPICGQHACANDYCLDKMEEQTAEKLDQLTEKVESFHNPERTQNPG